jgi:hypothetical protein
VKTPVYFCKSWFRAKKRPTEVWTAEQAKHAHQNRQPYTVLVGSIEQPYCFLEVADKVVGVGFLDQNLRESLSYDFQECATRKQFLTMATHREFAKDSDEVVDATSYVFKEDGTVHIRREVFNPHRIETTTISSDISKNYADCPEFGEYDDFIKIERG